MLTLRAASTGPVYGRVQPEPSLQTLFMLIRAYELEACW